MEMGFILKEADPKPVEKQQKKFLPGQRGGK